MSSSPVGEGTHPAPTHDGPAKLIEHAPGRRLSGAGIASLIQSMALEYLRNDATRRIRLTLIAPVSVAELLGSVERQLADGAWRYGVLVDARLFFPTLRPSEMHAFVSGVRKSFDAQGPRGPIAVVARESGAITIAQLCLLFGGKAESIEFFANPDDAEQWLDDRMRT